MPVRRVGGERSGEEEQDDDREDAEATAEASACRKRATQRTGRAARDMMCSAQASEMRQEMQEPIEACGLASGERACRRRKSARHAALLACTGFNFRKVSRNSRC